MNKHKTYEMFPQLMSPSMVNHNAQEAWKALYTPYNLTFMTSHRMRRQRDNYRIATDSRPLSVDSPPAAEFMDTSDGIPWLTYEA